MFSALVSGSSGSGSCASWRHCVEFLSKTIYSLHPRAGDNLAMDQHPIQEELEIPLVTSCQRNRDKLKGQLGWYAVFAWLTFYQREFDEDKHTTVAEQDA